MNVALLKQVLQLRKRSCIFIALLFIAALGLQLYVNISQGPKVSQLAAEWRKQREFEGRGLALHDRATLYKNGQADLAKFRERVYPKAGFAKFIGELYGLAAVSNLDLLAITYKPSFNKEEQLLEYALVLTVSGNYPQLKKFIFDLGASSNIVTIDSVSMVAVGASSDSVQLQVMLTSYFKTEEK